MSQSASIADTSAVGPAKARRPLPQALTLTDAAAQRVKDLVAKADKPIVGLRIGVKSTGCSGLSYDITYAEDKKPWDEVVEEKGATILVDSMALMYVVGAVMDYRVNKLESGFVFDNPNETARCGCGESFSVDAKAAAPAS